jgi:NAD-dependent deacetylase
VPRIQICAQDRVFILTGAGISAESGLPTFRAEDGLWAGFRIEDVCTPQAWQWDPATVWAFYSARRAAAQRASPNPAHIALAEIESAIGNRFFLCTQNVDDLHERAGSTRLVHMHGELTRSRCERACGRLPIEDRSLYQSLAEVPLCPCGGRLRPHIVFFGETPLAMGTVEQKIAQATLMVVVGTSGAVYPAANFVHRANQNGARTIYVGPEPPLNAGAFRQIIPGNAAQILPLLFDVL